MAGNQRLKTRAARRKIMPAVEPGVLNGTGDVGRLDKIHGSPWARHFVHKIHQLCEFNRAKPMPRFEKDTRRLDRWLQGSLDDERTNFLAAFIDQASMIQANRPYRITGSRGLVARTLDFLHMSEGGEGFRKLLKLTALNYYMSNFGGAVYLNRVDPVQASYLPHMQAWDWQLPAVNQMFATDPTLFAPRDDYVYPVEYDGTPWTRYDYFRIASMPSTITQTWGVGRCALYRCIQIAKMTSAIYEYIYDLVSPDSAKGIVTIQGMNWDEFLSALTGSEAVNEQDITKTNGFIPGDGLGDILVLADRDNEIDVKFVTLGRLPEGFFLDQWVRWTLTSFATNLGFPLDEFIGMPSNRLLGQSGSEVESGERRGGTKGGAEFINQTQELMQQLVVPTTVHFEFSERDASAEIQQTQISQMRTEMAVKMFEAAQLIELDEELGEIEREAKRQSQRIINASEARRLLVEWGVLPEWITQTGDDLTLDDGYGNAAQARVQRWRNEAMESPAIKRLAMQPLGEPVVMFEQWVEGDTGLIREHEVVLWDDDNELARPTAWAGYRPIQGEFRTASMAQDWGNQARTTRKKPRLEHAIRSDHADSITRIVRTNLVSGEPLNRDSRESLSSRLYALAQIGRDSVIGRDRMSETNLAEMAGALVNWAGDYTQRFAHTPVEGEATDLKPDRTPLGIQAPILLTLRDELVATIQVWSDDLEAALPEAARERAREIAQDLACRAFAAGQYVAAERVNANRKQWVAGDAVHASLDGAEVPVHDDFQEGIFWAGMKPKCRCEVKVK